MLDELFKTECIKYGKFTLKSGEISKYYFDSVSMLLRSVSFIILSYQK